MSKINEELLMKAIEAIDENSELREDIKNCAEQWRDDYGVECNEWDEIDQNDRDYFQKEIEKYKSVVMHDQGSFDLLSDLFKSWVLSIINANIHAHELAHDDLNNDEYIDQYGNRESLFWNRLEVHLDEEGFNKSLSSYYSKYKERLIKEAANNMIKSNESLEQLIADLANDPTFTGPIYDEYGRVISIARERYYKERLEEYFQLAEIKIPYPNSGERDLFVNALVLNIYARVSEHHPYF